MRSYRLAAFAAAFLAVAAAGLFAPPAQPARAQGRYVPPPPCACRHLPALQAELRNALLLERRMRAQAERLRNMSREEAHNAYAEFSRTSGEGLEPVPGAANMSRISYTPFGDTMSWEGATSGRYTDAQLCARSGNAQNDLDRGLSYAACREIADVLREHEDFHVETCVRVGYRTFYFMHKSEVATDEAEAYGRQAARLRAIIMRIIEEADPRVVYDQQLIAGEIHTQHGETPLNQIRDYGNGEFLFSGEGQATTTVTMGGGCSVTSGSPFTERLTTRVFTDGLTAHINVGDEAASHELGFQCSGHGGSRRFVRSNGPPSVRVKFEDRATAPYGFSGLGGLGSTTGTVTLHICRKSGP